jgi:signal transduction histidine kinase
MSLYVSNRIFRGQITSGEETVDESQDLRQRLILLGRIPKEGSTLAGLETLLHAWATQTKVTSLEFRRPAIDGSIVRIQSGTHIDPKQPWIHPEGKSFSSPAIESLSPLERRVWLPNCVGIDGAIHLNSSVPWTQLEDSWLMAFAELLADQRELLVQLEPNLEQTRLIQRLADGSLLAGRMAHDFDNLWTGILGFADLALMELDRTSSTASHITEISTIGQRGIAITAQLHQLSRASGAKPNPSSLNSALTKERTRLSTVWPKHQIEMSLSEGIPLVAMESQVLHSALAVILDNAVEAMGNGGLLRIEAEPKEISLSEAKRFLGSPRPGRVVLVRVIDGGVGIKPEVQKRLFHEPFFTTKIRHRGLGLAIAYRILNAHHGGIRIESELGKGTSVTIALPPATKSGQA